MLKNLIWLFVTLPLVSSSSTDGCLRFEDDHCLICDSSRFYSLNDQKKCVITPVENCLVPNYMNHFGHASCLRCNLGYYLSNVTNKCVTVPSGQSDQNCIHYSQIAECLECGPGYIIKNGVCSSPENSISNCDTQVSESQCLKCKEGYVLQNNECNSASSTNNCVVESDFQCNACKSSYTLSPNSYLSTLVNDKNYYYQPDKGSRYSQNSSSISAYNECIQKNISYCSEYNSFGKCSKCNDLFHIDVETGNCVRSPESKIFQCAAYSSLSNCTRCNEGYYLSSNECLIQEERDLCLIYKINSTGCSVCEDNYYSSSGNCVLRNRSLSVSHCTNLKNDKDECASCESGFIISSDGGKCFVPIAHCTQHNQVSSSEPLTCQICAITTIPTPDTTTTTSCELRNNPGCQEFMDHSNECKTCSKEYYNNSGVCTKRTKKCKLGEQATDNCSECYPQQYLDSNDNSCKQHTKINCDDYHASEDSCESCNSGFYLDDSSKECFPYNLQNCQTPNPSENSCDSCAPGYYPISTTSCRKHDLLGCETPNDNLNICDTCLLGFYKDSNNLCHPHNTRGCTPSTRSKDTNTCTACEDGFFFNTDHCEPYTVSNCATLEANSDACQADGCRPGYQESSGKCYLINTPNCDTYDVTTKACTTCATGYYPNNGICTAQYSPGCKTYTTNTNDCSECHIGWKTNGSDNTICDRNELEHCMVEDTSSGECTTCGTGFKPVSGLCKPSNILGCKTYDATNTCTAAIDNYFRIDTILGVVKTNIENCIEYASTNATCTTCASGYYLASDATSCDLPTSITGCLFYDPADKEACLVCENLQYVNTDNECASLTTPANCLESNGKTDVCTACASGFYIDSPNCSALATSVKVPANCLKNTGTSDTDACSHCMDNHLRLKITHSLKKYKDYCQELRPSIYDECNVIMPGWHYKDYEWQEFDTSQHECIQLANGQMDSIDNGQCKKCKNVQTHFINLGKCKVRSLSVDKCHTYNPTSDECLVCSNNPSGGTATAFCAAAMTSPITNCELYAFDGNCYQCSTGNVYDADTSSCITRDSSVSDKCLAIDTATDKNCTSCKDGYENVGNSCYSSTTCKKRNQSDGKCQLCHKNYKFDGTDEFECVADPIDGQCEFFTNPGGLTASLSYCVKCKGEDYIVLNNKDDSSNGVAKYSCIEVDDEQIKNSAFVSDGTDFVVFSEVAYSDRVVYRTDGTLAVYGQLLPTNHCLDTKYPNCKTVGTNGSSGIPFCTECQSGFFKVDTPFNESQCMPGALNGCMEYSDHETCVKCAEGFKLVSDACVEIGTIIDGCVAMSLTNPNVCNQCQKGFLLFNGVCFEVSVPNCKYQDFNSNICFECNEGFYVNAGTCYSYTVNNCLLFDWSSDYCISCIEGYYNKNGLCLMNTSLNCLKYSKVENKCFECEENYYLHLDPSDSDSNLLKSGNCYIRELDPYCLQFNPEANNCEVCQEGYFMLQDSTICQEYQLNNCITKSDSFNSCLLCEEGFFTNDKGLCSKYTVKGCKIYSTTNDACDQCYDGFYLDLNFRCTQYDIDNCDLYDPFQNSCIQCLPGFFLNGNTICVKYSNNRNCKEMQPDYDLCSTCNDGFYNNKGRCDIRESQNCLLYKADEDLCLSCQTGFYLQSNTCVPYSVICKDFNPFDNKCITCKPGYFLYEGYCYINDALGCLHFSSIRRGCESCHGSDYLEPNSGSCLPRIDSKNCSKPLLTADLCESCPSTHLFVAGKCILREKQNCASYDSISDICTSCHAGKNWFSHGVCEEYTIENCEEYEPDADLCVSCVSGNHYLGTDKLCHPSTPVEKCQLYSSSEDKCVLCEDGYYQIGGTQCRPNPEGLFNCIEYSDNTTCTRCSNGYYLEDNYCFKSKYTIDNCDLYSSNIVCEVCKSNYVLATNPPPADDDTTSLPVGHPDRPEKICLSVNNTTCTEWENVDSCSKCSGNQVLQTDGDGNKSCVESGLTNCEEASGTTTSKKCIKCAEGNYINGSNECAAPSTPIDNCAIYKSETECSECASGFVVSEDKLSCSAITAPMSSYCDNGMITSSKVCKACAPNYYLDEDYKCTKCGGDNCDICSPYNLDHCWLCMPGFEHDGKVCNEPAVQSDDGLNNKYIGESENNKFDPNNGISMLKHSVIGLFMLCLISSLNK